MTVNFIRNYLPFALFAYNSVPHEATGESPHFLLHGFDAVIPRDIDPAEKPTPYQVDIDEYKQQVLENLHACQEVVRERFEKYRVAMEKDYNNTKRSAETSIVPGDLVYIELPTERAKNALSKLAPRWEGPARVLEVGKTHVRAKMLQGGIVKDIHLSQIVKWRGLEEDAQILKGTTTRKTRKRLDINATYFSDQSTKLMTEWFECKEKGCELHVGMILPGSSYASTKATSIGDLAEKAFIAGSAKFSAEVKDKMLKEGCSSSDEEVIDIPKPTFHAAWRAALQACPHRREAFKAHLGKELAIEEADLEMLHNMMAFVANARFIGSLRRDVDTMKAQHWNLQSPDEILLKSKVIFGAAIKRVFYVPDGELFFQDGANFKEAAKILLESIKVMSEHNFVKIIVLPAFRRCDNPDKSQEFIDWFKLQTDERFIGNQEVDEKKLINWLDATPRDSSSIQYVDAKGLLTKEGVKRLGEYLSQIGHTIKIDVSVLMDQTRDTSTREKSSSKSEEGNENNRDLRNVSIKRRNGANRDNDRGSGSSIRDNDRGNGSSTRDNDRNRGTGSANRRGFYSKKKRLEESHRHEPYQKKHDARGRGTHRRGRQFIGGGGGRIVEYISHLLIFKTSIFSSFYCLFVLSLFFSFNCARSLAKRSLLPTGDKK